GGHRTLLTKDRCSRSYAMMLTFASARDPQHKDHKGRGLTSFGPMETIDPASISADLLERDDGTEPVQVVPPVVAVVVTNDPGPWLEETLNALADQDYPALSVLVVDNGSVDDPTARIAAAMPGAFVRRRPQSARGGLGFSAAAND